MDKGTVFVSYSHRDESWKDRLVRHLAVSLDRDSLEVWDDTRIPAGSDWQEELTGAMTEAEVAILLISADYLASEFVRRSELPFLLARAADERLQVLPVIVRPCAWRTVAWMRRTQVFPQDGSALSAGSESEIEEQLARVTERVVRLLDGDEPATTDPQADTQAG